MKEHAKDMLKISDDLEALVVELHRTVRTANLTPKLAFEAGVMSGAVMKFVAAVREECKEV
jgi:hypothetical protein